VTIKWSAYDELEDNRGAIKIRKSKKGRPHNDQKKKNQKNKQKYTIHYTEKIEQYKSH
jgi:hypothetical protein